MISSNVRSSLSLQFVLYLNRPVSYILIVLLLFLYLFKVSVLPYSANAKICELLLIILFIPNELLRLYWARKGNLTETSAYLSFSLLLNALSLALCVYWAVFQSYVLLVEFIAVCLEAFLVVIETLFGIIAVANFSRMTLEERSELIRKYKYYYASVRPQERDNRVTNANGSFFALNSDLKIISTKPQHNKLHVEIIFGVTFVDNRLIFRELKHRFRLPEEFQPWLPEIATRPHIATNVAVYLDPLIGIIDAFYKYQVELHCSSEAWQHPFQMFNCEIAIFNIGDERIFLRNIQDLRNAEEIRKVSVNVETFTEIKVIARYPELWYSSMVNNLLPSMVIFCVVIFAQCRRRKIHMFVTISALICIVFMQSVRRTANILTLEDLWLSATFLHIICVLLVDLMIPSRRIQYVDISDKQLTSIIPADVDIVKRMPAKRRFTAYDNKLTENGEVAQQQISTTTLGPRKRLSLAAITCCYFIFVLAYFSFVLYLILMRKNFLW